MKKNKKSIEKASRKTTKMSAMNATLTSILQFYQFIASQKWHDLWECNCNLSGFFLICRKYIFFFVLFASLAKVFRLWNI